MALSKMGGRIPKVAGPVVSQMIVEFPWPYKYNPVSNNSQMVVAFYLEDQERILKLPRFQVGAVRIQRLLTKIMKAQITETETEALAVATWFTQLDQIKNHIMEMEVQQVSI